MAKTDIGPRISVEGESEYRKQMSSIIQQQKEYSSELNLVTANLGKHGPAKGPLHCIGAEKTDSKSRICPFGTKHDASKGSHQVG